MLNPLILAIVFPLIAALAIPLAPRKGHAYPIALIGTLLSAAAGVVAYFQVDWLHLQPGIYALTTHAPWMDEFGISFSLGVNSVSGLLIALTLLLGPICVIASRSAITERVRTYYGWLLVLQAAMVGVFAARDMVLFYVCFEFTLIPMFVLISLFGSTNRRAAGIKFFLYTFTGSIIALAGIIFVAYRHSAASGGWSFDIDALAVTARTLDPHTQAWVFAALMAGFAVKVPLFPLHTWLPLAHTEAPTAGSVILAGVLLKLGTYAIYAFAIPFAPLAAIQFAPLIGVLSIIGILAVGLVCWVQTDVKKLVAYSSVAHLGFCMLGMFALNPTGLKGAVLYMINHGLSTGAIFLCIGMVYERYHTRSMLELGGLARRMPVWACFMVFFAMASVGLPMLNGFVSEFMCLLGAWQASDAWSAGGYLGGTRGVLGPTFASIAGLGMIVAAMYTLYMVGKVVWGPLKTPDDAHGHEEHAPPAHTNGAAHALLHLPVDLSRREIGILVPLAACCLLLGLYPKPFLAAIDASTQSTSKLVWDAHAAGPAKGMAAASPVLNIGTAEGVKP
jgi:NADH-quinone oxidoreductase subunit M